MAALNEAKKIAEEIMKIESIMTTIESGKPIYLTNKDEERFLYFDQYKMLIPLQQENINKEYGSMAEIRAQKAYLNNHSIPKELIKSQHAEKVFLQLEKIADIEEWRILSSLWFVETNSYLYNKIYNGRTHKIENLGITQKARVLRVMYLQGKKVVDEGGIHLSGLARYGLTVSDTSANTPTDKENVSMDIQELLDCDKIRCGLPSYEREMLYDIKAGHWDVFENSARKNKDKNLVDRDPKSDIKKNGIIGIDFGTKSTVVVRQEGSNEIIPIRIGSLSLKAEVSENDYENPTIISCTNIKSFLENYNEKSGRPETSCDDLFVSYNAYQDYKNCPTENFYAYYSELKQWANSEKPDAVVQDIKEKEKYYLADECSIEKNYLNPIEIYAYYIGMYINNMRNGIYLKYIMSFPVKYSKSTKEMIRKSFEKGIRKSLPTTIVEDAELMSKFSVDYQISEPAAYAVTALGQSGFKPNNENERYLYGIFDFGGGTADFDFGVWRGADGDEYNQFNCDYVLECFGADSDPQLGGEKILEMLAYQVFKSNKTMAAEKKIACALPAGQRKFEGGDLFINNSQSANRNLTLLKEALRPLWEQHDDWEAKYCRKNNKTSEDIDGNEKKEEYIEIQMYDFNGKPVPNCRFNIDTRQLIELIRHRIKEGVDAFFKCIEKSILGNESAQYASEKVYIFLAGNSCKSIFVKEIFQDTIKEYNGEYARIKDKEQDRFELIDPLVSREQDDRYIPNAKTSVAYGLVKSRPGGKIYVKKSYETDSYEETSFKYYLGSDRRDIFDCKLAPMMKDENGENQISYGVWHDFQGAGMGVARVYYTQDPRANVKGEKLDISDIPFHEITFEADKDKRLFVRAVQPSVIEYTIADSIEEIGDVIEELDIDKK